MNPATLFSNPIELSDTAQLLLVLPLCIAVAIVYKTIRLKDLHRLWLEVAALVGYMIAGLGALGLSLWLIREYWP